MSEKNHRDYGRVARIGIATPQANPTVEPEIRLLLPAGVSMHTSRCCSQGEPRQRFYDYFANLAATLKSYDSLKLDALGFACTASSYLHGTEAENRHREKLENQFGYPIITAASAINDALNHLGAKRIALACPYPQWLFEIAVRYWQERGFEIVSAVTLQPKMNDTRAIYNLQVADASTDILKSFTDVDADAFVITGTGMPGLQVILDIQSSKRRPAINSNLCLAWKCLQAANAPLREHAPTVGLPLLGGWAEKLSTL